MHGEGTLKWPDGKCYKGVSIFHYKRIMNKIKNKEKVYFILVMVENMQELGLMENNLVLESFMIMKNNIR